MRDGHQGVVKSSRRGYKTDVCFFISAARLTTQGIDGLVVLANLMSFIEIL